MGARHYSAELGRFLQPDPTAAEANQYAYVGNSPVSHVDPSGTCFQWLLATAFGGPVGIGSTIACWGAVGLLAAYAARPLTQALVEAAVKSVRLGRRVQAACVVIGQGMDRVRRIAARLGCGTYGGVSGVMWAYSVRNEEQLRRIYLNDNKRWIRDQMRQKRIIVDIGPGRFSDSITSPYYWTEYWVTMGYAGVIRAWGTK
jgi:hypothetical protein